jgi:hypothetical protein
MGAYEFGLLDDDSPFGCSAGYDIGQSAPRKAWFHAHDEWGRI